MTRKADITDGAPHHVSESELLLFGGELAYDIGCSRHQGAWLSLDLLSMARTLPKLVGTAVGLARQADARALRTVWVAELGRGVAQAVGLVAVNRVLGHVLAEGSTAERLTRAVPALVVVAVVALLGSLLGSASTAATGSLEPKVQRVATERYLSLVARVELSAIEDDEFHRLLDSAGYGADSARRMVTYCTTVLNALISLAAAAGVLTVLHPLLLPLLVAMTLPSAWSSLTIAKLRYVSFHAFVQHARASQLLGRLLIDQQAAAEVRVHDVAPFLLKHYRGMAETNEREQTRLARAAARKGLLADGATGIATAATYGVLGALLWFGGMDLAVAGTAVLAIRTGSASLDRLVLHITDLHQESLFVGDLEALCRQAAERAVPREGRALPERIEEIRFEGVTFTYPGETAGEPSLREVDVTIPTGRIVALVGSNGSGKSTLARLLCGLYRPDPGGGRILWGGVDAAEADRAQIFSRVAVVAQDFYRWPFTARVNIGIGRSSAPIDDADVREAGAYAGADRLLEDLPRGLSTLLARGYKDGHQLSGGQWQKLGIARARYRRAEVLVVDEPTSALDPAAEQRVFDQIRSLAGEGQTVVLITHRLHSVRDADLIYVLDRGRVVESGTFEELMDPATGTGHFREAYELQARQFLAGSVPAQDSGSHHPAAGGRVAP
ncbi:ABC transporter ATP-binding protein [Streptomyces roseolilacinus]|uniref:ABC transporter ATP-binding protein n=1 Tax=Streptomyces roseolilacinus TaxID=66904 RepID=UPI0037FC1250